MSIHFFNNEGTRLLLRNKAQIKSWITHCCKDFGKRIGTIHIIFCDDEEILQINREFLQHNYYTDIITFSQNKANSIGGELYISVETVHSNAIQYGHSFLNELHRVIIHGVLHLLGLNDKTELEQRVMRENEDKYLNNLKNVSHGTFT